MPDDKLIDYYSILRVPAKADLAGVQNAYAQLSSDLARRMGIDDTSAEELRRLNEAYSVLAHPELRRDYNRVFFASEIAQEEHRLKMIERRRAVMQGFLIGALVMLVAAQAVTIAYMGREQVSDFFAMF